MSESSPQLAPSCYFGLTSAGLIKVAFPFDPVTQAELRKIRPRGVWSGRGGAWEFPFSAAEHLTEKFGTRFVVREDLSQWITWSKKVLPSMPRYQELVQKSDLNSVLLDGRKALPHQRLGARWLLARRGALLADEMGLGKTLTSLLAARAMARAVEVHVMVVAPVGLHSHWLEEANALDLQIDLRSWARLPKELSIKGTLLIVDEAHFAQSLNAKRTQALLRLARHPCLRAIWMLTGTPMKNGRPSQLFPLLAAIDHPLGQDKFAFEKYFCQGHGRERGIGTIWDCNVSSNLNDLKKLVKPFILNRTKDKSLGLPPKLRLEHLVTLSSSEMKGFNHRLALFIDDYRQRTQSGLVPSTAESLAFLTVLRKISAEFKLPSVSQLIKDLIGQGENIVLFSSFVQPLELLKTYLGGELLTGRQNFQARELAVNNFQAGNNPLLLATYGAGGLGFTLHRARHVILLERPWTPGDVAQAEDRCHRLGMDGSLTSHWFQLGLADQLVDGLVANKSERIEIIMGSSRVIVKRQSLPKMLFQCIQEL